MARPTLFLLLSAVAPPATRALCGFCPLGYPPTNPDATHNGTANTTTCFDVHTNLTLIDDLDECTAAQSDYFLKNDYPAQCGYCDLPPQSNRCTLCSDGSIPAYPANTTTPFGNATSCGQLAYAALFDGEYSPSCAELRRRVGSLCGCPLADEEGGEEEEEAEQQNANSTTQGGAVCPVCPDGTDMPNPYEFSNTLNMTCGDVAAFARASLVANRSSCSFVQALGISECGCAYSAPTDPTCRLCVDGSVPEPTKFLDPTDAGVTCGLLEWEFGRIVDDEVECSALQATAGAACGCNSAPEPRCKVECPEGNAFDLTKTVQAVLNDGGDEYDTYLCGELLWQVSVDDNLCNEGKVELAGKCCVKEKEQEQEEEEEAQKEEQKGQEEEEEGKEEASKEEQNGQEEDNAASPGGSVFDGTGFPKSSAAGLLPTINWIHVAVVMVRLARV